MHTPLAITRQHNLATDNALLRRTVSGIAHWAWLREAWLKEALGLKRLPCTNTYHYVCAHLDVGELNGKVREWLGQVARQRQADAQVQWALAGKVDQQEHSRKNIRF